jgi:hypothetical protein
MNKVNVNYNQVGYETRIMIILIVSLIMLL